MQSQQNDACPAVFLDRDGVLIENIDGDYVRAIDQIKVLTGARTAVARLIDADILPVIVTNQAAVAKGFITLQQAWSVQKAVELTVAKRGQVISIICPHAQNDDCECRKPKPGMLLSIAEQHNIDLNRSFLIGDALTDIKAARAAGVTPLLVLTGRGKSQHANADQKDLGGLKVFPSVTEAVNHILSIVGGTNDE